MSPTQGQQPIKNVFIRSWQFFTMLLSIGVILAAFVIIRDAYRSKALLPLTDQDFGIEMTVGKEYAPFISYKAHAGEAITDTIQVYNKYPYSQIISLGISAGQNDDQGTGQVLSTDQAMKWAKLGGGNQVEIQVDPRTRSVLWKYLLSDSELLKSQMTERSIQISVPKDLAPGAYSLSLVGDIVNPNGQISLDPAQQSASHTVLAITVDVIQ